MKKLTTPLGLLIVRYGFSMEQPIVVKR
uniref:Uncharacterized protein n=1 Tax=Anopheles arabiensis TaxID=7173 RepID=A0A182IFC5_ANOAR